MPVNVNIRRALPPDFPAIVELYSAQLEYHRPYDSSWDVSWPTSQAALERLGKYVSENDRIVLVAEKDNRIIGYLTGSINPGHVASIARVVGEIDSMHVLKAARSGGIGRLLVERFFEFVKEKKVDRIKVTATTANQRAIDFYRSVGFKDYSSTLVIDREEND